MKIAEEEVELSIKSEELLPPIGFLADLGEEARTRLARAGMFVTRPAGSYLAVQGRPHHAMALLLSGRVSVNVYAHGDRVQLAVLARGDVVGEMSVIDPRVASATARVVGESSRLWIIERSAFDQFIADDPAAGLVLLKSLGKVLCRRVRTDSELMLRKAEQMRAHCLDNDY